MDLLAANLKYNLLLVQLCEDGDKGDAPGIEVLLLRFTNRRSGVAQETLSFLLLRNPICFDFGLQTPDSQFLLGLL